MCPTANPTTRRLLRHRSSATPIRQISRQPQVGARASTTNALTEQRPEVSMIEVVQVGAGVLKHPDPQQWTERRECAWKRRRGSPRTSRSPDPGQPDQHCRQRHHRHTMRPTNRRPRHRPLASPCEVLSGTWPDPLGRRPSSARTVACGCVSRSRRERRVRRPGCAPTWSAIRRAGPGGPLHHPGGDVDVHAEPVRPIAAAGAGVDACPHPRSVPVDVDGFRLLRAPRPRPTPRWRDRRTLAMTRSPSA